MIRFISDLAAQKLWPLFLIGCFITTLFFNISFYQFVRQKEHHNNLCIYFSFTITIIGGLSLLMIGVFDNIDFKHLHDVFVTIFMWVSHATALEAYDTPVILTISTSTGYIIGAVAICIDYFYLMTLYGAERRILFASFFIKVSFIITELAFILPFRIMAGMHHAEKNAAAVLEWGMLPRSLYYIAHIRLIHYQQLLSYSRAMSCPSQLTWWRMKMISSILHTSIINLRWTQCIRISGPLAGHCI